MFFVLSKIGVFFLSPSNLLITLALVGALLMATRWRRAGTRLAVACVVLLALAGFTPIGARLQNTLENRFPRWNPARGAPDGIIVLGSAINPLISRLRGDTALNESAERVTAIAKLARAYPQARIVYSGGDASLRANSGAEADYLYPLLDSFGVPRGRVLLENRSRNTAENAAFTKELVKPKVGERWLLVTSAAHMPRAVGCFRRIGFPVEAYPVDWTTTPRVGFNLIPDLSAGLSRLDIAVHEWAGLFVYWLTGRTSELLPAP